VIVGRYARRAQRRDGNEGKLTKFIEAQGWAIIPLVAGQGADLLLLTPGQLHLVEIKNPETPAPMRKLTPDELRLQALCQRFEIPYNIVLTESELAAAVRRVGENCDGIRQEKTSSASVAHDQSSKGAGGAEIAGRKISP
jgi:hypothetical protein